MAQNTRIIVSNAGCYVKTISGCYLESIVKEFIRILRIRIKELITQKVNIREY